MSQIVVVYDNSLELMKEILKIPGEIGYELIIYQNLFKRIFE